MYSKETPFLLHTIINKIITGMYICRLQKLAEEFYICVKPADVAKAIKMEGDMVDFIFSYWVLKRKV